MLFTTATLVVALGALASLLQRRQESAMEVKPVAGHGEQPKPCLSPLDRQLQAARAGLSGRAGAAGPGREKPARLGFWDVVLPEDEREARAMNGMAVLGVSVYVRRPADLPILKLALLEKRAGESGKRDAPVEIRHVLPRVFPADVVKPVPEERAELGARYQTVFALVPLELLSKQGSLLAVLSGGRSVELGTVPLRGEAATRLAQLPALTPDPRSSPDAVRAMRMVVGGFCLTQDAKVSRR